MKKIFLPFAVGFLSLSICNNSLASINSDLDKIIQTAKPPVHIGIVVRQANTGNILYAYENQLLFSPASVQKVVTATAALLSLGKDFRFKTELLTNGKIINNTLMGNVAIKFYGDPELTGDNLQQLIGALSQKGIKKIQGNVYIDKSAYDDISYPPGWLWDDLSYSYAAPLSAVNINKNKFVLHLTPSNTAGNAPSLSTNIPNSNVHFVNHLTTVAHPIKNCPVSIYSDIHNNFYLHGCVTMGERSHRILAIRNTIPYATSIIQKSLANNGIQYTGKIIVGNVNKDYQVITTHYSVPLPEMLKHMLKKSDNLISNSLLKQMGYQSSHTQGNWTNGKLALETTLQKATGIDFSKILIDDGAGMSRYNLITPNQLSLLLEFIYKQPVPFSHILIDALPIAGVDGTLIGRMYSEAAEKRVRAKTGSMTGVSALAGYVFSRHLGPLSFTIMINNFIGKATQYKRLEDKICEYLAK